MYLTTVVLLMLVLPVGSVWIETLGRPGALPAMLLVGKWFVFWAVGLRLVLAGLRQLMQPRFTSETIFRLKGEDALPLVRELGVANLSLGLVGLLSLGRPGFVLPVALAAALFYGIAGLRHVLASPRTSHGSIAMVSDLFVAAILGTFVAGQLGG